MHNKKSNTYKLYIKKNLHVEPLILSFQVLLLVFFLKVFIKYCSSFIYTVVNVVERMTHLYTIFDHDIYTYIRS